MKKIFLIIALLGIGSMIISSCDKYLDVKPDDKILGSTIFESEIGAQTALNGVYLRMSYEGSYGGNLMLSYVEILGQQFNTTTNPAVHSYAPVGSYQFGADVALKFADDTWTTTYASILNVNKFISSLGVSAANVPERSYNLMMGQAYALRAMFHMDLLRLFGPVYSIDSTSFSIPYYSAVTKKAEPILPANQVLDSVMRDLDQAKIYLENDPIRTAAMTDISNNRGTDVSKLYQLRANYYMVCALKARLLLYRGDKANAYIEATQLIEEIKNFLDFTPASDLTATVPDRIFSAEIIFGLYNQDIVKRYDKFFNPAVNYTSFLTMSSSNLLDTYEDLATDVRLNPIWITPSSGKTEKSFYKFEEIITDISYVRRYIQPLIRLSEIYLIAAESASDPNVGMTYENAVRNARGLHGIEDASLLDQTVLKEYRREFVGEGQLFFTYKRRFETKIKSGQENGTTINMDASKYVIPLPKSETDSRN